MNKYGLHGSFKAKKGQTDTLVDILIEASKLVSTAKGCQLYVISKDATTVDTVWVTEIWDSKTDHDNSLSLPGVRELISRAIPLIEGTPAKGQELDILGGTGI